MRRFSTQAMAAGLLVAGLSLPGAVSAQQAPGAVAMAPALDSAALPMPSGPVALALSGMVPARFGRDSDIAAVYAARGFAPFWLTDDGAAGAASGALMRALAERPLHALPASPVALDRLAAGLVARGPAEARAELEIALTEVYLRHAREISSGLLEPRRIDSELHLRPQRPEPAALLTALGAAADPYDHMASLPPQTAEYRLLVEKYARFRALAAGEGWGAEVRARKTLHPGDRDPAVPVLRARLRAMGDLPPPATAGAADAGVLVAATAVATDAGLQPANDPDPMVYDAALEQGVLRFQERHGLNQDGAVGPATRAALNVQPGFRARQVAVNLERLRWLNRDLGKRHIVVNLAGFRMRVMEDGREVFTSRVVIGKRLKHRTPEFSDEMEHMVINPTWNVPKSIAREEILPKLKENPYYLIEKNMRLIGAEQEFIDWSTVTPDSFPGRIAQNPGAGNALGRVKFMFPNNHAIYLHDTPSRSLFARDVRDYSHGCVRVARPIEFAEFLLAGQEKDPGAAFRRWLDTGREIYVHLKEHVPVHITYRTAWHDETSGTDQFRNDIYRRDKTVIAAMEQAGVALDF